MLTEREALTAAEATIRTVITDPGQHVLEAGCGSVRWIDIPKANVSGIDISEVQLDLNKHYAEKILGDIERHDLGRDAYDLIVSWDVFEHLDNPAAALANLASALRPGGAILIKAPLPNSIYGLVTRATPTWFHRAYYRFVLGLKDVRIFDPRKDVAPFATLYRRSMFPKALTAQAEELGLRVVQDIRYEIDMQKHVRTSKLLFRIGMAPLTALSRLIWRDDRIFVSSFILIFQRPT